MGVFDQPDSPDIPAVVREYHDACRRVRCSPTDLRVLDAAQASLAALSAEVGRRGGRWEVGRLLYKLDDKGLWVEQAPSSFPAEGEGGGAVSVSSGAEH